MSLDPIEHDEASMASKTRAVLPPQDAHAWRSYRTILIVSACLTIAYTIVGYFQPSLRPVADTILSPITATFEALKLFGPGSAMMEGPIDALFYRNLIAIGISAALALNANALRLRAKHGYFSDPHERVQALMRLQHCTAHQAKRMLRIGCPLLALIGGGLIVFALLNSLQGWFSFQLKPGDWLLPNFLIFVYVLPSGFLLHLLGGTVDFFMADIKREI